MYKGKIAIPSEGNGGLEGFRSAHFGHCDVFTIVDVEQGKVTGVSTVPTPEHHEGGCLVPVNLLAGLQVNALIAGGMGMRPLAGFNEAGIEVFFDTNCRIVGDAVEQFISGKLTKMTLENTCGAHH